MPSKIQEQKGWSKLYNCPTDWVSYKGLIDKRAFTTKRPTRREYRERYVPGYKNANSGQRNHMWNRYLGQVWAEKQGVLAKKVKENYVEQTPERQKEIRKIKTLKGKAIEAWKEIYKDRGGFILAYLGDPSAIKRENNNWVLRAHYDPHTDSTYGFFGRCWHFCSQEHTAPCIHVWWGA